MAKHGFAKKSALRARAEPAAGSQRPKGFCVIGKMRGVDDSVERRLTIKPGVSAPPHALDREEIFIALSGRLTVTMDDEVLEVEPGDALVVRTNSSQWPTPALSLSRPLWCFRSAARV